MNRADSSLGFYARSKWLLGTVTLLVCCAFAAWLLRALDDAMELAEKTMVDQTLRNIRIGLRAAMGDAIMTGRAPDVRAWAGEDPVRWLGYPPKDYRGDCGRREVEELLRGHWCFDREARELVYRPRHTRMLRWQHASGEEEPPVRLRWRLAVSSKVGNTHGGQGSLGVNLEVVKPYSWSPPED